MKEPILITEGSIASGIYFLIKEKIANPQKEYTMKDLSFIKCRGWFKTEDDDNTVIAFDNTGKDLEQVEFDLFYETLNMLAAKKWCKDKLEPREIYALMNTNAQDKIVVMVNSEFQCINIHEYNHGMFKDPEVYFNSILGYRDSDADWMHVKSKEVEINYL